MYYISELAPLLIERLIVICMALFVEVVIGRMAWFFRFMPHPCSLIIWLAGFLARRLNKNKRGARTLVVRGAIVVLVLALTSAFFGGVIVGIVAGYRFSELIELSLLALIVSQRGSYSDASNTMRVFARKGLSKAKKTIKYFHKGRPEGLDINGVYRGIVEHLACALVRWLVAPIFWYLVFGLPGLFFYTSIACAAEALVSNNEGKVEFGWFAHRLEILVTVIPAWLCGHLVVLASTMVPTANPMHAWRIMCKYAGKLPHPAYSWSASAMAGALSFKLGGANSCIGGDSPWFGEGATRLTARDAQRAMLLFVYSCVLNALMVAVLAITCLLLCFF